MFIKMGKKIITIFAYLESGLMLYYISWADPEGGGTWGGDPPPPVKSTKYRVS